MSRKQAIDFIISRILAGERDVDALKRKACGAFGIGSVIRNPELLSAFPPGSITPELKALLLKKPVKTASGVTPVAVMIRPQGSCMHKCIYCPAATLAAKSYTGFEPAALRGRQFAFDPYLQVSDRVAQLSSGGHATDKCELIVMGGTFLETGQEYRRFFIQGIYEGLNGKRARSLEAAMDANEKSRHRAIGLTLETRPDVCLDYIDEMLSYGATRVELGVQHADDRIYALLKRGHGTQDVVDATRALKNAAFKVLYHIMPGLPGSGREKDISFVRKLFDDPCFRPDMLKVYPTLVIAGTGLQEMADAGDYEPYSAEDAADVISEFYRYIPKYVRVMRIQRDIPASRISSGVKKSNLRELVEKSMKEKGITPQEIRSREVGLRKAALSGFGIRRLDYDASGGMEVFLSCENQDNLIAGFIRMRFPAESSRREITSSVALIRELHVYGTEVPLESSAAGAMQHRGIGSSLLHEAEAIARDSGKERMVIISGVGAREYYRKHGYQRLGPYMAREL